MLVSSRCQYVIRVQRGLDMLIEFRVTVARSWESIHRVDPEPIRKIASRAKSLCDLLETLACVLVVTQDLPIVYDPVNQDQLAPAMDQQRNAGLKPMFEAAVSHSMDTKLNLVSDQGKNGAAPEDAAAVTIGIEVRWKRPFLSPIRRDHASELIWDPKQRTSIEL